MTDDLETLAEQTRQRLSDNNDVSETDVTLHFIYVSELLPALDTTLDAGEQLSKILENFLQTSLDSMDGTEPLQSEPREKDSAFRFSETRFEAAKPVIDRLNHYLDLPPDEQAIGDLTITLPAAYDQLSEQLATITGYENVKAMFDAVIADHLEQQIKALSDPNHDGHYVPID